MKKKIIIRSLFINLNDDELTPCPVCETLAFDKKNFPGTEDICGMCYWQDDSEQYRKPNFEESSNEVSLNQARENYKSHATSHLTMIPTIRKSIILELIYGFELESKKTKSDRIEQSKSLSNYLRGIIREFFFPDLFYDDLEKLKTLTNKFYEEEEVIALNKFAIDFKEFIERVGVEQPDEVYTNDYEWSELQKQASDLVELMQKNNPKYHFDEPYIKKQISY